MGTCYTQLLGSGVTTLTMTAAISLKIVAFLYYDYWAKRQHTKFWGLIKILYFLFSENTFKH